MGINKRKLLRVAAALLSVVVFLLVAAYAFLLWESHRQRQRAEGLLNQLQALKIGETPAKEALQVLHHYIGAEDTGTGAARWECGANAIVYRFLPIEYPEPWLQVPLLGRYLFVENRITNNAGLRYWRGRGSIAVAGGRLVCLNYDLEVLNSKGAFLEAEFWMEPAPPSSAEDFYHYRPVLMAYTGFLGEGLGVVVTHRATEEEKGRVFDFNFDCLTRMRECKRACELMPSVWREEVRQNRAEGEKPRKEESDPRCQAVLASGEKKQP